MIAMRSTSACRLQQPRTNEALIAENPLLRALIRFSHSVLGGGDWGREPLFFISELNSQSAPTFFFFLREIIRLPYRGLEETVRRI